MTDGPDKLPSDRFEDRRVCSSSTTLQLSVSFLRPVRPGRILGRGRAAHRDGDLAFLEASLLDSDHAVIATATATARVIALSRARSAA